MRRPRVPGDSLFTLCVLLFLDGATLAVATTPLLLAYAPRHEPWQVALAGGLASAAGSAVQLLAFRWILERDVPWLRRFVPTRQRIEQTLANYPSASFLAIALARATPLPDAPLKLVAAVIRYPVPRYFLAVLLGGAPYYFLISYLGHKFVVPSWVLVAAVAVIVAGVAIDFWRKRDRAQE